MNNDKKFQSSAKSKSFMRRCLALLTCVGMLGSFAVPYQEVLSVIAEDEETSEVELICGMEEHIHTDECYSLICEDNSEEHEHTEECYKLTCDLEEHQHSEECYEFTKTIDTGNQHLTMSRLGSANILAEAPGESGFSGAPSSKTKPSTNPNMNYPNKDQKYFTEAATVVGDQTYEIKETDVTGIKVTINNRPYSAPDSPEVSLSEDSVPATFAITYTISTSGDPVTDGENGSPCIYYQLPDGVEVPSEYYGYTRRITDNNYTDPDGGHIGGYFSINENGLIVIQFTQDYIKNKINLSGSFTGSLNFNGVINRASTENGDRTVDIGGLSLKLNFPNKSSTVTKEFVKSVPQNGEDTEIAWTVKVKNATVPASLSGHILEDAQFVGNTEQVTVEPAGVGDFNSSGQFVFNDDSNNVQEITFTYTQVITNDEFNEKLEADQTENTQIVLSDNTATLKDGDIVISDSRKQVYGDKPTIVKEGEAAYKNNGWISSTMYWSINVSAPAGNTLENYYVQDEIFKGKDTDGNVLKIAGKTVTRKDGSTVTFPVTDENGYPNQAIVKDGTGSTLTAGTDYVLDENDGTIRFLKKDLVKAVITYATDCKGVPKKSETDSGRHIVNTASLLYPQKTSGPSSRYEEDYYNSPYRMGQKSGDFDYDNNQVIWHIGAEISNKDNPKIYLNNDQVDFAFKDASLNNLDLRKITLDRASWNSSVYDFKIDYSGYNYNEETKTGSGYLSIVSTKQGDPNIGKEYGRLVLETLKDSSGNDILDGDGQTITVLNVTGGTDTTDANHPELACFLHSLYLSYKIDVTADDLSFAEGQTSKNVKGMTITKNGDTYTFSNEVGNAPKDENGNSTMGNVGEV